MDYVIRNDLIFLDAGVEACEITVGVGERVERLNPLEYGFEQRVLTESS